VPKSGAPKYARDWIDPLPVQHFQKTIHLLQRRRLQWEDVDLEGASPYLIVRRQRTRLRREKSGLSTRERAKTEAATDRRVPLSTAVVQLFGVWKLRQQSEYQRAANRCKGALLPDRAVGPAFTSTRGTRLEPRKLYRAFERISAKAGASRTLHGLRHDVGSTLAGWDSCRDSGRDSRPFESDGDHPAVPPLARSSGAGRGRGARRHGCQDSRVDENRQPLMLWSGPSRSRIRCPSASLSYVRRSQERVGVRVAGGTQKGTQSPRHYTCKGGTQRPRVNLKMSR